MPDDLAILEGHDARSRKLWIVTRALCAFIVGGRRGTGVPFDSDARA